MNRAGRRGVEFVLGIWPKSARQNLTQDGSVRRVLLVRVNHRLGNTVLATAMLPVLRARYPGAEIDILAGDTAATLLEGVGFDGVHLVSRSFISRPWRAVSLLKQLRKRRYDVALDGGLRSFSGGLYSWLVGAPVRIGGDGKNACFRTVQLRVERGGNVYDVTRAIAGALDVPPAVARPSLRVSPSEAAEAESQLANLFDTGGATLEPFVGLFVGGHLAKRWPRENWLELCRRLARAKIRTVVFVGPEEVDFLPALREAVEPPVGIVPPQSLRRFAALLSRATLLVSPDSGPMHMAAALGVPVLGVFQREMSFNYLPPGSGNRALMLPDADAVIAALAQRAHGVRVA